MSIVKNTDDETTPFGSGWVLINTIVKDLTLNIIRTYTSKIKINQI